MASLYKLSAAFNVSFDYLLPPLDEFIKQDPVQDFNPAALKAKNEDLINKYLDNDDE